MPNSISSAGLTVASIAEIISSLTTDLQTIYGASINVDSNSPDGQLINIFAQSVSDMLELLVDVYNSFTVQSAYGTLLDQRVAINGITRRQGTYTLTNVTVTVNQALTLTGLDALVTTPTAQVFTLQDAAGNQFNLVTTYTFSGAGSAVLVFQAATVGQIQTTPNTITNQVTTVLGVTAVNNPTAATSTGVNEETDPELKVRHAKSFDLAAIGPADSVEAALRAIPDIVDAYVIENATSGTVLGTAANTIWTIVRGGTSAEIAQAIYAKKGIGCGMRGAQSYTITRPNGNGFVALWDTAIGQPLYIQFTIQGRITGTIFDATYVKTQLAAALSYKLGQAPTIGDVISAMLTISPTGYLTSVGVSTDGITYFQVVQPTTAQYYFTVSTANMAVTTA